MNELPVSEISGCGWSGFVSDKDGELTVFATSRSCPNLLIVETERPDAPRIRGVIWPTIEGVWFREPAIWIYRLPRKCRIILCSAEDTAEKTEKMFDFFNGTLHLVIDEADNAENEG